MECAVGTHLVLWVSKEVIGTRIVVAVVVWICDAVSFGGNGNGIGNDS